MYPSGLLKDFLILLTGATYDFKDVLFKHGWRWASLNRGWKYNKSKWC